jgi:type II secretory pathway predicted ATPase ExeA
MYETFFGLKKRPFSLVPDTESYFAVGSMEECRKEVEKTLRSGEGLALVIGESGTGKTLLLRMIRQALEWEYTVSPITNGLIETPKAFYQQLLYNFHLPF